MTTLTPDALIALLSWQPDFIFKRMLESPDDPIKSTVIARSLEESSPLLLDTLPPELLYIILGSLDCQSLSRLARVCHRAKTLVESLWFYQDLTKYVAPTLRALGKFNLTRFHAVAKIHAALLSDKCVSCQGYGYFLHLTNCERCCYACLKKERSLRMMTDAMAKYWFYLSPKDFRQIPVMVTDKHRKEMIKMRKKGRPRVYGRVTGFVSVKHVHKLAISILGSQEALDIVAPKVHMKVAPIPMKLYFRWLRGTTLDVDPRISEIFQSQVECPDDSPQGFASIIFPSLRHNGELERALWCVGCRTAYENYTHTKISAFSHPSMSDLNLQRSLWGMGCRARSRSEFLEHIKDCKGARDFLAKTEEDDKVLEEPGPQLLVLENFAAPVTLNITH